MGRPRVLPEDSKRLNIRVDPKLWEAIQAARERRESTPAAIRRLLRRTLKLPPGESSG